MLTIKRIMKNKRKEKRSCRLILACCALLLFISVNAFAQQQVTVTGNVKDEKGEPIIGANVIVKGTGTGSVTNVEGDFSLANVQNGATLEISFIGYLNQDVKVNGTKPVSIILKEDTKMLDEVVVVGYGVQRKSDMTGAVASVNTKTLENRPQTNIIQSLQGAVPGLNISVTGTNAEGSSTKTRIRGENSITADNKPLVILDGIPFDGPWSEINPNDIESIEVLKDASSSAIYGSRGANGVVLITTKQAGTDEKVRVQFQASFGMQSLERKVDVLSPEEWIEFRTAYNNNRYISQYGSKGATIEDDYATRLAMIGGKESYYFLNDPRWTEPGYGNLKLIDWQDEFFRLAPIQNYQLSLSSGRGNTKYRVSMGYTDQEGIAIESNYKRLNFRANVESKVLNRITVGVNLAPSASWNEGGRVDGKDRQATNVLTMAPVAEPEDGIYTGAGAYGYYRWTSSSKISPVAYMEHVQNKGEKVQLSSSAYVKADIWNGIKAEVTGSYNFSSSQSRSFVPSTITKYRTDVEGYRTTASRTESRSNKFLLQGVLHYDKTFGRHTVGAMAGYSMESSGGSSMRLSATQFPDNSLEVIDMADVVLTAATASLSTPSRLMSYFGRLQYEYDDRYLLTASIRRDGSSRFGKANRWGIFPAVSGAYRISNEKFWPKDFVMNSLKLRASWGANGNNSIPTNTALAKLSSANYSSGSIINGFAPTSLANPDLGWEKTESWNVAFDMGLFNNRIFLSADYYVKTTKDLLYQVTVPALLGFTKAWGNIGSIRNKGFELEVTTQNLTGRLKWSTSLNVSYNQNKVLSLGDDNSTVFTGYDSTTQVFMVNQPLRSFYMYDAVGVYQTQADLQKYPVMQNSKVGDVRYRDANGDGVINDSDRTLMGKPDPDYTFGITNTFKYKNFDLSFLITAQTGGQIYSVLGRAMDRPGMGANGNVLSHWKNMWKSEAEPGDGKTPGIDNANTGQFYDSRWLYSTDFIKLKNVTLGYRIPFKKKFIQNARVYLTGENLLMWDKYEGGFSPEANNGGSTGDYDYGSYPQARVITLGVNVTF